MLLSLEAKLVGGAVVLAAALAGLAAAIHHERVVGSEKVTAAVQHAADVASAANAIESARRVSAQEEADREADRFNAQRLADAHRLDAVAMRVRQRHAASGGAASNHSDTASISQASNPSSTVPADVYLGLVDLAGEIARFADAERSAAELCAKDYAALTKP